MTMVLHFSCPCSSLLLFFILKVLLGPHHRALGFRFGINYGRIAGNLPAPSRVAVLLQTLHINRVKLYDADPDVLRAFRNTNIEVTVGVTNGNVLNMVDPNKAQEWIQQNVQPFLPQTRITCITVGNEVLSGTDATLMSNLVPAMQSVHQALAALGLEGQVTVTTPHAFSMLATSYPPSAGSFREDLRQYLQPLLDFHAQRHSPFLINIYPFFAYKAEPNGIPLGYVLFEPNPGVTDPNTNLRYENMLYAQIDSVYSAIAAMGHTDVEVRVSETGWPSKGDPDEAGATPANAAAYNGNLLRRVEKKEGTPMRPSVPIDVHIFALFNEDLKPGPASERNYGLLYPDGTPVYDIGLQGSSSSTHSHPASSMATLVSVLGFSTLLPAAADTLFLWLSQQVMTTRRKSL